MLVDHGHRHKKIPGGGANHIKLDFSFHQGKFLIFAVLNGPNKKFFGRGQLLPLPRRDAHVADVDKIVLSL